jgi:hypothetical protein
MRRAFMFLLVAPISVATIWTIYATVNHAPNGFVELVAFGLLVFTLLVATLAALADSLMASTLPALVRAPLTGLVGAAIPASVILAYDGCLLPPSLVTPFGIGGALCMGICSLLSNDGDCLERAIAAVGAE